MGCLLAAFRAVTYLPTVWIPPFVKRNNKSYLRRLLWDQTQWCLDDALQQSVSSGCMQDEKTRMNRCYWGGGLRPPVCLLVFSFSPRLCPPALSPPKTAFSCVCHQNSFRRGMDAPLVLLHGLDWLGSLFMSHASFGSVRSKTVFRRGEFFNIDFYSFISLCQVFVVACKIFSL